MSEKVVPFRVITSATPAPAPKAPGSDLPPDLSPKQRDIIESISHLANYLLVNKLKVSNFLCVVGLDEPVENMPGTYDKQSYIFSSAMQANDFALAVKLLENAFFKRINNGSN